MRNNDIDNNQNYNINNNIRYNNNINNENDNNINYPNQRNNNYEKKYSSFTISFIIIFIINIYIEIYSFYKIINSRKYVFQYAPIYEKKQYYRFVTNYFIHYGIAHLIIELYITYKMCNLMENAFGTILTITFIMMSMIINSIFNFLILKFMIYIFNIISITIDLNYEYESGLTSVLFTMATFYFNFKHIKERKINLLYFFFITAKYISITAFFLMFCFTPNKSYFSSLSGILNGYLFKMMPFIFLPKVNWIKDFEKKYIFPFLRFGNIYRNISKKKILMVNVLNELQKIL